MSVVIIKSCHRFVPNFQSANIASVYFTFIIMPRVPSGVTPKQRVFQNPKYKENYYASEDNKLLFCKACESPVDHSRPKSLEDHLKTAKHERAVKRKQERNLSQRRQGTLEGAATAAANRNDVTQDFVAMMTEAECDIMRPH